MTPLRFHLARAMRNDSLLASLSVSQADLLDGLDGRSVALVGNARALAEKELGGEIDGHDVVVRINRAPMPSTASHGQRTDWLGLAVRLGPEDRARIQPRRILWMSPKRKRLDWETAHSPGFYLYPLADNDALEQQLGAPPTTGLMLIDLLLRSKLTALTLYGFDFFASLSLTGSRTAEQVPHDFGAEADWVTRRAEVDPRIARR